jgi:hypothetical protein
MARLLPPGLKLPHGNARLAFRKISTRLAVLYTSLFAVALLVVATAAQVMILNHARALVNAELSASGSVFDQVWALRAHSFLDTANVLTRDFGFRSAVATGDRPTIESALYSLRKRAGVYRAFLVTDDGAVIGDDRDGIRNTVAQLPYRLAPGRR